MADVGRLIASLRATVDGQGKRIRHLERMLSGGGLLREMEPERAEADAEYFSSTGCTCGGQTCGCIPHILDGHGPTGGAARPAEYGADVVLCGEDACCEGMDEDGIEV